jgi:hypothetical protein
MTITMVNVPRIRHIEILINGTYVLFREGHNHIKNVNAERKTSYTTVCVSKPIASNQWFNCYFSLYQLCNIFVLIDQSDNSSLYILGFNRFGRLIPD